MMILIIITMSFVANELDCAVSHLLSPLSINMTTILLPKFSSSHEGGKSISFV